MHIITILLLLFAIWFAWSFIAALVRRIRQRDVALTILANRTKLDSFVEKLTEDLAFAADRQDRIDILAAQIPEYLHLCTGQPIRKFEKRVRRHPKSIEMLERELYENPHRLIDGMKEIDQIFPR